MQTAEKHMPDATGPSQPANAEAFRPSCLLAVVPAACTVVPSSTVFRLAKAELLKLWSLNVHQGAVGYCGRAHAGYVRVERLECDLHGVYGFEHWQDAGQLPTPISAADMWAVLASSGSTAARGSSAFSA